MQVYVAANPTATEEFNRYPGQVFRSMALFVGFFFRVLRVCRKHQKQHHALWYMVSSRWNLEPFVPMLSFTSHLTWNLNSRVCAKHLLHPRVCRR